MLARILFSILLLTLVVASPGLFGSANQAMAGEHGLNDAQKKEVETLIKEIIANNPEMLILAIQKYQAQRQELERQQARNNLLKLSSDLNVNPASPVIGNPDGDVTVVEFFDYRCGFCKRVFPTIQALLKEDGNIRYVLKEFPILGPVSVIASQTALAVWNTAPDKYMPFHTALMTARGQLNEKRIFSIAEGLGIDVAAVRKTMNEDIVSGELNKNMSLAQSLGINGTPAFVIGEELAPGAISMDKLKEMVAAARKG